MKLDLRKYPRDENGHVQSQSLNGIDPASDLPSFVRDIKREILVFVASAEKSVNRADIAKGLKLQKTTWLNTKIEELVQEGHLIRMNGLWKNGFIVYWYTVPDCCGE